MGRRRSVELGPRTHHIPLERLGLAPNERYLAQSFWDERFLGVIADGVLTREIAARHGEVIALRRETGWSQLLGTNRQLLQGATDLEAETWDESARTLTLAFRVDAAPPGAMPFEYRVRVHVPDGDEVQETDDETSVAGPVLTWRFTPGAAGLAEKVFRS